MINFIKFLLNKCLNFFNYILIFKQISIFINFSKHSYICYLFKIFYMFEQRLKNLNFLKISLKFLKIFVKLS